MCDCVNVEIQSYDNQIVIDNLPKQFTKKSICLDKCISEEVLNLWKLGITTTGCCCGHNKLPAFIGVIFEDISKMKVLGYRVQKNHLRPKDEDSFYSKSIKEFYGRRLGKQRRTLETNNP